MTKTLISSIAAALFTFLIASCSRGGSSGAGAEKAVTPPQGIVGVWERIGKPDNGRAGDIIVFRDDGFYVLFEGEEVEAGNYSVIGSALALEGGRYALGGWRHAFEIERDRLILTNTLDRGDEAPNVETTAWRFTRGAPLFPTAPVDGQPVVSELPVRARAALSLAREINPSRELVRIDLEERAPGAFTVNFYTVAPNRSGARVQLRPYHVAINTFDKTGWGLTPLPVDFIDLPDAVQKARTDGFIGRLTKAELLTSPRRGPVWRLYALEGAVEVDAVADASSVDRDWSAPLSQYESAFGAASNVSASCAPHEAESDGVCAPRLDWLRCRADGGGYRGCLGEQE